MGARGSAAAAPSETGQTNGVHQEPALADV
jgi:hypothetical protein